MVCSGGVTPAAVMFTSFTTVQRLFEKFSSSHKPIQHEPRRFDIYHGFRSLHSVLVVFAEPTVAGQSGEAAFDNPGEPGDLECSLPTLRDLQLPPLVPHQFAGELAAPVAGIGDDRVDSWEQGAQTTQ
jgi:hypothetical protein